MTVAAASLELDARALAMLDRLLDAGAAERHTELQRLQSSDAALHARVVRLLDAAADPDGSRVLSAPLVDGLRRAIEPALHAGDTVAGWRLLRLLGRGGMSVVWLAERAEGGLRREVAIKLPLESQPTPALAERFARERDVLAALDHPHIARLFDAGVMPGGQPYIVLEYVHGRPLTEAADGLSTRERLLLFGQVLSAVDHAHRHLVVHRDLKPSNILVTEEGQVKLLDFGIAKLLEAPSTAAELTREGGSVLTPRYAAPEQVLGEPVGTATDIYGAAVVLHELLTGRLPYGLGATTAMQLMQAVLLEEPQAPGVSQDIDTILLKALRKAPEERYASVERFAEDLRRVLADEPILARRVPWWQRTRLLVRRHPRASAAAAFGGLLLLALAGVAWQQGRATEAQKVRGDAVRDFVFSMMSDAEPAAGRNEVTGKELLDAATARARTEFADKPRLRGELLGELGRVYFRLNQAPASIDVLQESLALLNAEATTEDAPLNRTRALLARSLITTDSERATTLARQALEDCPQRQRGCADAREHAYYALAALASWRGAHLESLRLARRLVSEAEVTHGARSLELLSKLETLGMTARNAGELTEAAAAIERVRSLPGLARIKAINRNRLDLTQAVIHIDLGRYAEAHALLSDLLRREAAPDERASQWRALTTAELGLGRAAQALHAGQQALESLASAPRTAAYWLSLQAWALAASTAGQHVAAINALAETRDGLLRSRFAPDSEAVLRVRRQSAEALLRARQDDAAAARELDGLLAGNRSAAPARVVETARTLDALGCATMFAGRADDARRHFEEAARLYGGALPGSHPLRLRSEALQTLAAGGSGQDQVERYRKAFAADSPFRSAALRDCRDLL